MTDVFLVMVQYCYLHLPNFTEMTYQQFFMKRERAKLVHIV